MLMLTLGVLLWSFAHLFKRLAPAVREGMGDGGKLVVTLALIGSIALITCQPSWVLLNNALMVLALYLMVASSLKVRVTGLVRHPQLTAIKAWSVGHLLVNGDAPSFVLFGGLLIWAVVTVIVINRQDGKPALPSIDTSLPREVFAVIVTGVLYFGVAQAHAYLGYPVHG